MSTTWFPGMFNFAHRVEGGIESALWGSRMEPGLTPPYVGGILRDPREDDLHFREMNIPPPVLGSGQAASHPPIYSQPLNLGPSVVDGVPGGLSGLAAVSSASSPHGPIALHYGGPPPAAKTDPSYSLPPPHIQGSLCGSGAESGDETAAQPPNLDSATMPPDPASHSGSQSERLKVEDALNYLDQVKYKFGNQPQVYNDFLDIMKEFKSQSIDTPGVIQRVSHLFRGHPELIVGFNTFLPPGYKIEVSLSMMGQGGGYVVTTVQTGVLPASPSNPNGSSTTSSVIHQNVSGVARTTHDSRTIYSETTSNGRSSPLASTASLAVSNSFDGSPTPAFTHSFSSPFVQSAFPSLQSQPVEFNHAISYVNKIKNRFQGQPDKYKQFLEILHTYQKEQRNVKEGLPPSSKHLTEHEVYSQVAKLFENQEDLLQEFGQFLPDATAHGPLIQPEKEEIVVKREPEGPGKKVKLTKEYPAKGALVSKRPSLAPPPPKKPKLSSFRDIPLSEAAKYGTLNDYAFFDRVRELVRNPETYDSFLRCLRLYNEEIVSRQELVMIVGPYLVKHPDLYAWFKDFLGAGETTVGFEPAQPMTHRPDKLTDDHAMEIDFSTCKRLGASYCALPKNHPPPSCAGRSQLCKEVLNDVWVSFPTWSEDSTFITSRKTQFEEYIYRCEDERFELDVVIETNSSTIRVLEAVAKKMSRMSQEEMQNYTLDDCLGGSSPTIHSRAVRRLYGEKSTDIIEGLKRHPCIAVPLVLRRLKAKEEEWREAQKGFNKIWREQVERFYLKSLDHQGITFKQSDVRALRSKSLINEIETIYDERQEQMERNYVPGNPAHLVLPYRDRGVLDDACNLLLHHVRRQSTIGKEDKRRVKQLLKHYLPDFFQHNRMELSDDEEDGSLDEDEKSGSEEKVKEVRPKIGRKRAKGDDDGSEEPEKPEFSESRRSIAKRELKQQISEKVRDFAADIENIPPQELSSLKESGEMGEYDESSNFISRPRLIQIPNADEDESYTLYFANNCWYVFFRLHQILCDRLSKMFDTAQSLLIDETMSRDSGMVGPSPAVTLRLKPRNEIPIQEYYQTFLEMVKNLLDGNIEPTVYEDNLREMFGIHAYIAYTMDKVVTNAVRQLQAMVTDETCMLALEMFHQAEKRNGTGGLCLTQAQRINAEISYQKRAERAFAEENCVKVIIFKKECRMTMELLESEPRSPGQIEERVKWAKYVEKFAKSPEPAEYTKPHRVLLPRNIRKWKNTREKAYRKDDSNVENIKNTSQEGSIPQPRRILSPSNTEDEKGLEMPDSSRLYIEENLQCRFNPNSYKMIFVVHSENVIYLKGALKRARETHTEVSKRLGDAFGRWHQNWIEDNVSEDQITRCEDWFLSVKNSVTKLVCNNDLNKAPYRPVNRYVVVSNTRAPRTHESYVMNDVYSKCQSFIGELKVTYQGSSIPSCNLENTWEDIEGRLRQCIEANGAQMTN